MNKDELCTTLIEEKLIDETWNSERYNYANYIPGLYTSPLLSEVWDLYLHDDVKFDGGTASVLTCAI